MDENSSAEVSPQQMVSESSGTGRSCSGIKRERGPYKALSVLRVSTKLQLQRRNSLGHARVVEEEENDDQAFEEEPTAMDEPALRRRAFSGSAPSSRLLGRHRGAVAAAPVEGPRRNAPRGEWTQAEEAVLARKHMELGNKWTTISQFLPSRTDNDVKNIWHSTLRSKNSERRSFLRTYARAVRDCANDAEARKQAYEMAQRVCGAPQPIEAALAAVQEQYQLQLQIQAAQQDEEGLEDGMSPEAHQDMEAETNDCGVQVATSYEPGDLALHSAVEIVHDRSPPAMSPAQQALEPLPDMFRPSTSSRSNSAAESGQHSGVGMATGAGGRGRVSTAPSPLNQRSAPLTTTPNVAAVQPCPGPLDTVDASSVPSNGDLQTYPSAIPCRTLATSRSLCQPYTPSHGAATTTTTTTTTTTATDAAAAAVAAAAVAVNPGVPFGSRGEVESTCLVRLSSLQIADQLHRQQQQQQLLQQQHQQQMLIQQHQLQQQQFRNHQHQQQQQQLMMVSTMQSHDLHPSGMGSGPGTSASSPTNYQLATTPAPNTYHPHLQGRGSTNGMAPVMPSLSSPQDQATTVATSTAAVYPSTGMPSVLGGCGSASAGGAGDAGTIELDDLLGLGLDLTAEELAVLSRGGQSSATLGSGMSSGGGGIDGMQMPDTSQIPQQMLGSHMNSGCSVLGATTSISPQNDQPVGHLSGSLGISGSELLPIQHPHIHLQAQPPHSHAFDAFSAFLTDMEQKQRCLALQNQLQHQQQNPGGDCYGILQHSQHQHQLQQHHMLQMGNDDMSAFGMGSGSGYRCPRGMLESSGGRASASGSVGVTRTGYMVQHNTGCTEFHGLINCSSNYEMQPSGQQPYLDPTRMPFAPQQSIMGHGGGSGDAGRVSIQGFFAPVHEGFSSNNSLLTPMGLGMDQGLGMGMGMGMGPTAGGSQFPCGPISSPPKLWPGSCSGAGTSWAAGLLHPDACTASDARTMSPFCNDTAQAQVSGQVADGTVGATCSPYTTVPSAGAGCGGAAGSGGSAGLAGRGSGPYDTTVPNCISLPPALDNITMGLDSGNLLDCLMDVDLDGPAGDGAAGVGAGGSGSTVGGDSFDYMMRTMMRRTTRPSPLCPWQPLGQQQHQGQQQQQHEQGSVGPHLQDAMMGAVGGSRSSGLLASGDSPATGSGGPQPCQPAGMGMPYSSMRMGPMLRL